MDARTVDERMAPPEGKMKIVYTTALGVYIGVAAGCVDAVWKVPKPDAVLPSVKMQWKRIGFYGLALGTSAALYATAEYTGERVRQKEDAWNSAIGGAAAALVPGVLSRSGRALFAGCLICGIAMGAASFLSDGMEGPFEKYAKARDAAQSR